MEECKPLPVMLPTAASASGDSMVACLDAKVSGSEVPSCSGAS